MSFFGILSMFIPERSMLWIAAIPISDGCIHCALSASLYDVTFLRCYPFRDQQNLNKQPRPEDVVLQVLPRGELWRTTAPGFCRSF